MEKQTKQLSTNQAVKYLANNYGDTLAERGIKTITRRTVTLWLNSGKLRGEKVLHAIFNRELWQVAQEEIDAAINESRIPGKSGNPTWKTGVSLAERV